MRLFLFGFILFPFSMNAQMLQIQNPLRFLSLGDSYTIGQNVPANNTWPAQLKDSLLSRGYTLDTTQIIATTGWTTNNLINAIDNQGLENKNFNLVSLLIGVNNQYQGISLNQFNIEFPQLIDSAIRYAGGDKNRVFIVSIPDYAYTPFGQAGGNATQISLQIDQYNAISKNFADNLNIKYFDITPISRQGLIQTDLVANDGLHPSAKQYGMWVELMLQYIDSINIITIEVLANKDTGLNIFPNPVKDFIYFDLPMKEIPASFEVKLFSMEGKFIKSEILTESKQKLLVKNLNNGFYLLNISNKNGVNMNLKISKVE